MAQIAIREYDVKRMFEKHSKETYTGIQLKNLEDIQKLDEHTKYVIKPDMLFGKRGKRGLLGINLDKIECKNWLKKHYKKQENIDGVDGTLDVFLAEPIVNIQAEYYVSFAQTRNGDLVTFSPEGGVDIEENWDTCSSITISVSEDLKDEDIFSLVSPPNNTSILPPRASLRRNSSPHNTSILNSFPSQGKEATTCSLSPQGRGLGGGRKETARLIELMKLLFSFYRTHGFTSLECNPIAQDDRGNFHMIDAVAKIDDQEEYLQKEHWKDLEIPNNYGFTENAAERYIRELDSQTGASLKMKILNPNARIWTLFAGGGGSLVMTDSLGALGYASEIGNYGECSGNPSREFTREYTKTLLGEMLKAPSNSQKSSESEQGKKKYLIIAGAIANFTNVANTFQGVIDALEEKQNELKKQQVHILVRRGGINEKKGLQLLRDACKRLEIPAIITGSDSYMTDILREIKLSS